MTQDSSMARHALWRLLGLIPTLLMLITIAFFLMRVAPGGPFDSEMLLPADIQANLNAKYHLDESLLQQYFRYLSQIAVLDFGPSIQYKDWTVNELIGQGMPVSLTIGLAAMVLAFFMGTVLGITAALRQNTRVDYSLMGVAMLGISIPNFVIAPILILITGGLCRLVTGRWLGLEYCEYGAAGGDTFITGNCLYCASHTGQYD